MSELIIRQTEGGIIFKVKVVPGSSKTMLAGTLDGLVKIKVASPAERGKANAALIDFLAKILSIRKNTITIVSGKTSPIKEILIENISVGQIEKLMPKYRLL